MYFHALFFFPAPALRERDGWEMLLVRPIGGGLAPPAILFLDYLDTIETGCDELDTIVTRSKRPRRRKALKPRPTVA